MQLRLLLLMQKRWLWLKLLLQLLLLLRALRLLHLLLLRRRRLLRLAQPHTVRSVRLQCRLPRCRRWRWSNARHGLLLLVCLLLLLLLLLLIWHRARERLRRSWILRIRYATDRR